jgi:hypothetical protein
MAGAMNQKIGLDGITGLDLKYQPLIREQAIVDNLERVDDQQRFDQCNRIAKLRPRNSARYFLHG